MYKKSIVNSLCVDYWTVEFAIIAGNVVVKLWYQNQPINCIDIQCSTHWPF